ncbi:MAG TPA: YggS family pyridoxal phosphate-dependent enzyme [Clostridiales bacterium]|nr:YggS family pyridoxal phosphate-dependent enzyme [Clostridiales bacterium]
MRERLATVRQRIGQAALQAGRQPGEITLIGVSKFFTAEKAIAAVNLGLADLGENRVQEMLPKIEQLARLDLHPRWHLIGTLQKNKVRQVIGRVHLIHSADSMALLAEINQRSIMAGLVSEVLIQVNTAGEITKHGFEPEQLADAVEQVLQMPGILLRGLMTMAPLLENPDETLPIFSQTRELFCQISKHVAQHPDFNVLSMGMSHDYLQAIRCGATHVRIGTAIFGPRL